VLRRQNVCITLQFPALFPHQREDVLLFQHSFVVILAEGAEQLCRLPQCGWIDAGRILPQPGHSLEINQQGSSDHSVLTHEVFRHRDLWFLFRFLC
jgi:hypothetical protein